MLMILEKEFGCLDELDIDTTTKSKEEIEAINNEFLFWYITTTAFLLEMGTKSKGQPLPLKSNK